MTMRMWSRCVPDYVYLNETACCDEENRKVSGQYRWHRDEYVYNTPCLDWHAKSPYALGRILKCCGEVPSGSCNGPLSGKRTTMLAKKPRLVYGSTFSDITLGWISEIFDEMFFSSAQAEHHWLRQ